MTAKIVIEEKDEEKIGLTAYNALVDAGLQDKANELAAALLGHGNIGDIVRIFVSVKAPPPNPKPKYKMGDVIKDGKEVGVVTRVDWRSFWDAYDCVYAILWVGDDIVAEEPVKDVDSSAKLLGNVKELAKQK